MITASSEAAAITILTTEDTLATAVTTGLATALAAAKTAVPKPTAIAAAKILRRELLKCLSFLYFTDSCLFTFLVFTLSSLTM